MHKPSKLLSANIAVESRQLAYRYAGLELPSRRTQGHAPHRYAKHRGLGQVKTYHKVLEWNQIHKEKEKEIGLPQKPTNKKRFLFI